MNFNSVTQIIRDCGRFSDAKKLAGQEFIHLFLESSEENRQNFTKDLFSWTMNCLHSHNDGDRIAALTGLAFYLNFIDKEPELQNLITQLERILPAENVIIINGISYLFEHIHRKLSTPFVPRLFERCAMWIASRPTPHAILSSALLMKRLYLCGASSTTNFNSILTSVVNAAFKFNNAEAQNTAVELCMMSLARNPSVDEAAKQFILDSIVVFESRTNGGSTKAHVHGYLLLLAALMKNYRRITLQRFPDFFSSFLSYLVRNFDPLFIDFIAFFCENYKEGSKKFISEITSILKNPTIDFTDENVCNSLCRIVTVFPEEFCDFAFEAAVTVLPRSNSRFFDLVKSILSAQYKKVDHQKIFSTFQISTLSISVLEAMHHFLVCFPQYTFKFLAILHPLIKNIFEKNQNQILIALEAIRLFCVLPQFSCKDYWNYCNKYLTDQNVENRIKAVRALYSMCILNEEHRHETTINILYNGQNDSVKEVRAIIIAEFPECLLDTFCDSSLVSLVEQYIDDDSTRVAILAIELIGRIKKKFPVNTLSTFWTIISNMDVVFFHTDLINERKKLIIRLPALIRNSGEFSLPLYNKIIDFISLLFQKRPPLHQTFEERINQRHDEKCDRLIRISCLHVVQAIGTSLNEVIGKVANLTTLIINQLYISSHPTFHIEVLNTLRCIFRCVNVLHDTDINGLELINKLLSFIQNNHNPSVIEAFITLFGTIGPLDPFWFHSVEQKQTIIDSSTLSDPSKREKCYLDFVMGYIVDQLQSKSRNHEPTTLINAIVYIFQSDAQNCLIYLDVIIKIFVNLFNEPNSIHESLFSFLRSIILLVDVAILPHAKSIMQIVQNFLPNGRSIGAVRTVNALIYSLKAEFSQFGLQTFKTVISVLNSKNITSPEIRSSFLLTLTLLTIYSDGCTQEFFTYISSAVENKDSTSQYALLFLSQAIASGGLKQLVLQSLKLALTQINGQQTSQNTIQLLYVLIAKYPDTIMRMPVKLTSINPVLDELIKKVEKKVHIDLEKSPFAKQLQTTPDPIYQRPKMQFDPKSVMATIEQGRFRSSEGNWTAWALNFSQELALCSRSPAIRACLPLLMSSTTLHLNIFPLIFLSVWETTQNIEERTKLSNYIRSIISQNVPQMILHLVSATCESLDRANFVLFPNEPMLAGQISERCNSWFRALRFYATTPKSDNLFLNCLRIETQLKRKECALGLQMMVPQECTNCELLENLNMWSKARDIYRLRYEENDKNDQYIIGLLKCSVHMDDWSVIVDRFNEFQFYSKQLKTELGTVFGAAAISTGKDEKPFFESVIEDDPNYCYWRAIAAVKCKNFDEADNWISRGRNSLVRNEDIFESGNYEPTIPTICYSMIFEELKDVIDSYIYGADKNVLELWSHKLDYLARDPTWLRMITRARVLYNCSEEEKLGMRLFFFNSLRMQGEWELFDKLSKLYLTEDEPRVRLLNATVKFDRGISNDTSEFKSLINDLKVNGPIDVYCNAVCTLASRTKELPMLLDMLNDVIKHEPTNTKAWKFFAYTNLSLAGIVEKDAHIYANNAMKGFISLIDLKSGAMHYLCQLCSIFFNNAQKLPDFDLAAERLKNLPPESVDKIMPQLLTQFSHSCEACRNVAFKIIEKLADTNYHALAFSLSLIRKLDPTQECINLIDKIETKNVALSNDLHSFTDSLIYVAVLPIEHFNCTLQKICSLANSGDMVAAAKLIPEVKKYSEDSECRKYINNLNDFNKKCDNFATDTTALSAFKTLIGRLNAAIEKLSTIDVDEFNIKLSKQKSFQVAIPGLNCISKPPVMITHVNHIMKTIPSAQRPRKMTIVGSDGNTYKYLLKGGEDLRLDLHVMQLFSLINSILLEDRFGEQMHSLIQLYGITPLSRSAGMISWADGGKTLYSLIKLYRKLRSFPQDAETNAYNSFLLKGKEGSMNLTRIQKLELYQYLVDISPADQLRQVLWLKSSCAESWLIQATNFARSTSLMSFVGYVIGLGDRHPSNILVMERRGNVVHIDLSECFEKAALRRTAREVVPFRLTRMTIDALGPSGVYGVFSITASNVMNTLKRNQATILAFLDIFTKENIIDMMWYQDDVYEFEDPIEMKNAALKKAINRLEDKLNFREFGDTNPQVDDHVAKLIATATDPYNLAQMYHGWAPYW